MTCSLFLKRVREATLLALDLKTGWVHCEKNEKIIYPLFLALEAFLRLSTPTASIVLEGRALLEKLLAFQIKEGKESGLFPARVTDFPKAGSYAKSLELALVLIRIYKLSAPALCADLQWRLAKAIEALLAFSWESPRAILLKEAYENRPLSKELFERFTQKGRITLGEKLHWILSLSPFDQELLEKSFLPFYDGEMMEYQGPLLEERYLGDAICPSLFDLGASYLLDLALPDLPKEMLLMGALYPKEKPLPLALQKIENPERRLFNKGSMVIQEGKIFISRSHVTSPLIDGKKTNTWRANERLVFPLRDGGELTFNGEGVTFSRLVLGNRAGQEDQSALWDWVID